MSFVKYTKNELPQVGDLLFIPKIKGVVSFFSGKFVHMDGELFPYQVEKYVLYSDYVKYFGNAIDADWGKIDSFESGIIRIRWDLLNNKPKENSEPPESKLDDSIEGIADRIRSVFLSKSVFKTIPPRAKPNPETQKPTLNNRSIKHAIDQILKNAHFIDSIIDSNEHAEIKAVKREYSGADKGGKRYEVLDLSSEDTPLYAVVLTLNDGELDILCECKSSDKAKKIAAALESDQSTIKVNDE